MHQLSVLWLPQGGATGLPRPGIEPLAIVGWPPEKWIGPLAHRLFCWWISSVNVWMLSKISDFRSVSLCPAAIFNI